MRAARHDLVHRFVGRFVRHVYHVDAGETREVRHRKMSRGAAARGGVIELSRIRFGVVDKFLYRLRRQCGADHQHVFHGADVRDTREVPERIVRQFRVQRAVDGVARRGENQRVAVGHGLRHRGRADGASRAGPVLDDHAAAERSTELRADRPREDVLHPARPEGNDDARDVALRCRCRGGQRERKWDQATNRQIPHQSRISSS